MVSHNDNAGAKTYEQGSQVMKVPNINAAVIFTLLLITSDVGAQIAFNPATDYGVGTSPAGVALADLNGDRRPDMAVTGDAPDRVSILLNTGFGAFGAASDLVLAGGSSPHAVVAVDVDNDNDLDLVVTRKNVNDIQVLVNTGGAFTLGATTAVGGLSPRAIFAADVDGNGFKDVVTSNRDSDDVSVLLNFSGTFAPAVTYSVGGEPRGLTLADFNGDQLHDIAVACNNDRRVDVLFNIGGGAFGTPSSLSVGPEVRPDGVTAGDLDRDGDMDIAAASSGAVLNVVAVFLNTGVGTFAGAVGYPVGGTNPGGIVAADLDVDGVLDLATANQDSANLSALPGLGAGGFGAAVIADVDITPEVVAKHDLDGNGSLDLVTVNRDSNTVSVLLNLTSAVVFGDGFESGTTLAWSGVTP
jgi:hypothetical protein